VNCGKHFPNLASSRISKLKIAYNETPDCYLLPGNRLLLDEVTKCSSHSISSQFCWADTACAEHISNAGVPILDGFKVVTAPGFGLSITLPVAGTTIVRYSINRYNLSTRPVDASMICRTRSHRTHTIPQDINNCISRTQMCSILTAQSHTSVSYAFILRPIKT
jgi:hypothetical protein